MTCFLMNINKTFELKHSKLKSTDLKKEKLVQNSFFKAWAGVLTEVKDQAAGQAQLK